MTVRACVVGASGYTGGELLRLLMGRPDTEVLAATSRSLAGQPLHRAHPALRGHTDLLFSAAEETLACDALFLCMPHGVAAGEIERWREKARVVIDLSADFRLRSPEAYQRWYGEPHPCPDLLEEAVYGLPEISRAPLRTARLISGVGCNATAMILALLPLSRAGLIERVIADIKVGSSEGGREFSAASHHPERSRAIRTYAPAGHRHAAEVTQALGDFTLDVCVTAVELVRGALCAAHVIPTRRVEEKELWRLYREAYAEEPFVRIVCDKAGTNRLPDPRVLSGSNHADVGFAVDQGTGRVLALCAIDNLVKGAAGSALQAMNIALGAPERQGLGFPGLHPV